ncbi:hypothetical protein ACM26V_16920 [Salipaludibacillus sp. HK11]|uniref:hypothetical protein n=1 Tax=Salipaludibacillus sp. HK11 TaxID=3394320 RepID=UPI0039FCBED4
MSEINKALRNVENMKEVGVAVGIALGDAIRKHPKEALVIGGVLGGLYTLRNKKIKFKLKRPDLDIEFETE